MAEERCESNKVITSNPINPFSFYNSGFTETKSLFGPGSPFCQPWNGTSGNNQVEPNIKEAAVRATPKKWIDWAEKALEYYNLKENANFKLEEVKESETGFGRTHMNFTAQCAGDGDGDAASSKLFFADFIHNNLNEKKETEVKGCCILEKVDPVKDYDCYRGCGLCDSEMIHPGPVYSYRSASGDKFEDCCFSWEKSRLLGGRRLLYLTPSEIAAEIRNYHNTSKDASRMSSPTRKTYNLTSRSSQKTSDGTSSVPPPKRVVPPKEMTMEEMIEWNRNQWKSYGEKALDHYNLKQGTNVKFVKVQAIRMDTRPDRHVHLNFTGESSSTTKLFFAEVVVNGYEIRVNGCCTIKKVGSENVSLERCGICNDGLIHPTIRYGYAVETGDKFINTKIGFG